MRNPRIFWHGRLTLTDHVFKFLVSSPFLVIKQHVDSLLFSVCSQYTNVLKSRFSCSQTKVLRVVKCFRQVSPAFLPFFHSRREFAIEISSSRALKARCHRETGESREDMSCLFRLIHLEVAREGGRDTFMSHFSTSSMEQFGQQMKLRCFLSQLLCPKRQICAHMLHFFCSHWSHERPISNISFEQVFTRLRGFLSTGLDRPCSSCQYLINDGTTLAENNKCGRLPPNYKALVLDFDCENLEASI